MSLMIRSFARQSPLGGLFNRSLPALGGQIAGKVNPVTGMYPYKNKQNGGWHLYPGQGAYSMIECIKGNQPFVGHRFVTEVYAKQVVSKSFDVERHLSCQDRYTTVSFKDRAKLAFIMLYSGRSWWFCLYCALLVWLFHRYRVIRREPMELVMDRDVFWKNYNSFKNGIYFDHHRFDHMLRARRANKWGYHDVTMDIMHD